MQNSNVTAFRCDIERFTGPVQVLHEEPIEHNSIELVYFTFDGSGSQGFYSLDNYSADINSIISDLDGEQADRVNAVQRQGPFKKCQCSYIQ